MSNPYRLIVFDWEGTLGDTIGEILSNIALEAKRLKFGAFDVEVARQSIDLGLSNIIKKNFPYLTPLEHVQLLQSVKERLATKRSSVCLIPGSLELIKKLSQGGIDLAIASNKGQQSLQRVVQLSGIGQWIQVVFSSDDAPPKPCPQMLQKIMNVFSVTEKETLMIGDSVSDIEMAKSVQVDAVGIDYYKQQESFLLAAGAMAVFFDYHSLATYLGFY